MPLNTTPGQHPFRNEGARYGQDDRFTHQGGETGGASEPAALDAATDAAMAGTMAEAMAGEDPAWLEWREARMNALDADYRRWRAMAGDDRRFEAAAFEHWRRLRPADPSASMAAAPAAATAVDLRTPD